MSLSSFARKVQGYPALNQLLTRLFNLYGVKRKIKGENNRISYEGTYLYKVKILIEGNNNEVIIGKNLRLKNCAIIVQGDGHKLQIGDKCNFRDTNFTFTGKREQNNCR